MKVEIWSDVVCPFCYIGKRRFEEALSNFPAREKVEIVWRSFQLDPEMEYREGQSVHEYLARRKGVSAEEGKRMNDAMTAMARDVGLAYNFDRAVIANTLDAHRLLHLAKDKGRQHDLKERLFRAYYTEGRNIGDVETLAELGGEAGLDGEEVRSMLLSDRYRSEVQQDILYAQAVGARGVPFYVFNDKYAVSGAQPAELFRQVLEKVWEEERPADVKGGEEGFCTVDGTCD